jgi:tripartite-type tricarboxylate transporter receptor subunit TctC
MRTKLGVALTLVAALGLGAVSSPALAEYPDRPVTFIVPYAAGGATDLLARSLAQQLERKLGQPFTVENKPGASSAVAAAYVSKSQPDGYTIMMATSTTMAINPAVFKKMTYEPLVDLTPVALIATSPFVLVINKDLNVSSVADLVKLAKSKPGELTYGSSGPGSAHNLFMNLLASMTGIKLTHVPYKGTLPALNDVLAGHIKMMFADMSAGLPLIRSGKIKALGVSTATPIEAAPELKPLADVGVPGYDAYAWQMVVAPTKTAGDILDKLNTTLIAIQKEPAFRETIAKRGMGPLISPNRPELIQFVKKQIVDWKKVVQEAGVAQSR